MKTASEAPTHRDAATVPAPGPGPDPTPTSEHAAQSELRLRTQYIPEWAEIARLREHVALAMSGLPPAVRDAAVMVTSELAENAVKYGAVVPGAPGIEISIVRSPRALAISVVSGTHDIDAVRRLQRCTRDLASTEDKFGLYFARVQALADAPEPKSQLGLYRIALEGGFELECNYADSVLSMTATRTL